MKCPLLRKFYIAEDQDPEQMATWEIHICEWSCPALPLCILDFPKYVPPLLKKKLEEAMIPCPHCQRGVDRIEGKRIAEEIKFGVRASTLVLDKKDDNDWVCFRCSYRVLAIKPSPPSRKTYMQYKKNKV